MSKPKWVLKVLRELGREPKILHPRKKPTTPPKPEPQK